AEANAVVFAKKLEHGQQFAVRRAVFLDGGIHTRAKHLLEIGARDPTRRDVVAVGLSAELWVKRQGHLGDMTEIIKWAMAIFFPSAVPVHLAHTLAANVADAGGHAAGLHRQPPAMLVASFDTREAGNALFTGAGGAAVETLLIGAGLEAFSIPSAPLLV